MRIEKNISLKPFNTFNVDSSAKYFAEINNHSEFREVSNYKDFGTEKKLILGGGSNILFTKDFDGIVIKINNSKIEVISENDKNILIQVDAGVDWDSFVKYTIDKGFEINIYMTIQKIIKCTFFHKKPLPIVAPWKTDMQPPGGILRSGAHVICRLTLFDRMD